MDTVHSQDRPVKLHFAGLAAALMLILHQPARAQSCNPVIDGTYCATQMPRATTSAPSRQTMSPVGEIATSVSISQDTPGTLGAISFRGGSTCIGLLRRGNCN
jgi:hypothetical protein